MQKCQTSKRPCFAIEFIRQNAPVSNFINDFKSLSRVLRFIKANINLFSFDNQSISINPAFDEYFYHNSIERCDFEELHEQLNRDIDYSCFLYNVQGFDIDFIDKPAAEDIISHAEKASVSSYIDEEDESQYIQKVDSIKETNINEDAGEGAYSV